MCMRSHFGGTGSLGVYHGIRNHGHIVWQSHWNGTMLAAKIQQETRTLCTFDMRATVRFTGVREKESMVLTCYLH
jgi:hypothetical protein